MCPDRGWDVAARDAAKLFCVRVCARIVQDTAQCPHAAVYYVMSRIPTGSVLRYVAPQVLLSVGCSWADTSRVHF